MRIVLCGPPRVGKTTVAVLVAESLGWQMIDTDQLITDTYGKACDKLYRELGEAAFRTCEQTICATLPPVKHAVVALGGGILSSPCEGMVVFLRASYPRLFERLEKRRPVPAYVDPHQLRQSFIDRIARRIPYYEAMADEAIDTDHLQPGEVAEQIVRKFHGR